MFENITNITIKGEFFAEETQLKDILKNRLNILFGRNGSGKSTIARGLSELSNTDIQDVDRKFEKVELGLSLSDELRQSIYVFNEDFIERFIKIKENGVQTIVMLGNQVDIQRQIEESEQKVENYKKVIEECNKDKNKLIDQKSRSFNELKRKLQLSGEWADIDKKIKGNKVNSPVTDTTIDILNREDVSSLNDEKYKQKKSAFDGELKTFLRSKGGTELQLVNEIIGSIDFVDLQKLLSYQVEKPELSEREKLILRLADGSSEKLSNVQSTFKKEDTEYCPYCFREISKDEKDDICTSVELLLNEESEEYSRKLREFLPKLAVPSIDMSSYKSLFPTECGKFEGAFETYKVTIDECKKIVERRLDKIYEPYSSDISALNIDSKIKSVNDELQTLNDKIRNFNNMIRERRETKMRLEKTNTLLTVYKYKSDIDKYQGIKGKITTIDSKIKEETGKLEGETRNLERLRSQLKNTNIALTFINNCLSYVFFSKTRLVLEENAGLYVLKSNGMDVKPGKLSTGERNIIALCYFYAKLFDNVNVEHKYEKEQLIVIDDPISSFDVENRMGVMSLLRWQFDEILYGNEKSKILVMTHDIRTISDLQKVMKNLGLNNKKYIELQNKKIEEKKFDEINEYAVLLKKTYDFSKESEGSDIPIGMGNIMRRLLEAYMTFNYRKGIEYICDDDLLKNIPESKKLYYKNLMTRLVLNSSSHEAESVKSMSGIVSMFDESEIRRTAKSILSLMLYLNRLHIKEYLDDNAVSEIESWQNSGFDDMNDL